jgi:hypothetical protein
MSQRFHNGGTPKNTKTNGTQNTKTQVTSRTPLLPCEICRLKIYKNQKLIRVDGQHGFIHIACYPDYYTLCALQGDFSNIKPNSEAELSWSRKTHQNWRRKEYDEERRKRFYAERTRKLQDKARNV